MGGTMKNKFIVLSLALVGFALMAGNSEAAAGVRGGKQVAAQLQSTSPNTVTKVPTTVYSVLLGTGAVTDFVVLYDSANATAATSVPQSAASGYRGRYYSTATANGNFVFDPPLIFNNGLTVVNSTSVMSSFVTYEVGRTVQGY